MLNKDEIIKRIEENKKKVREFGVNKLLLVGSYAKDKVAKKSDIDFLVEFDPGRGLFDDFINLLHFLEDLFGKKIDLGEPDLLREEVREHILGGEQVEAQIWFIPKRYFGSNY